VKRKQLTSEKAEEMLAKARRAEELLDELWSDGMEVLPLGSSAYRAICTAGKKVQTMADQLWLAAGEPDEPGVERINRAFN